jgi:hypothetical protein
MQPLQPPSFSRSSVAAAHLEKVGFDIKNTKLFE